MSLSVPGNGPKTIIRASKKQEREICIYKNIAGVFTAKWTENWKKLMLLKDLSKILIISGIALVVLGVVVPFLPKIPFIGRLPGDIYVEKGNFKFYFPVVSSIIISIIVSLIIYFIRKQ